MTAFWKVIVRTIDYKRLFAEYSLWNLSQSLYLNSSCNTTRDVPQQDEPGSSWLPQKVNPAPVWCQPSWGETSVRRSSVTWRAERWGGGGEEMGDSRRIEKSNSIQSDRWGPGLQWCLLLLLLFAPAKLQSVSMFLSRHASSAGCVKILN